jgi:tRNA1Val (adenine37-N6)-methyltransferase
MSNHYFKFKQFTVMQEKCAMKVCTDACLFGALLHKIANGNTLDIGTGTGLLSLMLAQKSPNIKIDAVEIDKDAYEQALINFAESNWNDRLSVFHNNICSYKSSYQYDFIFSNPPFYENDLKSNDDKRNLAMHTAGLKYEDLLSNVKRLLDLNGSFAVLLPSSAEIKFIDKAAKFGLFATEITRFKQSTKHSFFRSVILFLREEKQTLIKEISIKDEQNNYTDNFKDLLRNYYLFM